LRTRSRRRPPTALTNEYSSVLRSHVPKTPSSFENVSPMLSIRLKPENHSPNELKRSSSDFVEAMNSHVSGMRKYTRNASMNSVGNT
jgi:hypothetical protein